MTKKINKTYAIECHGIDTLQEYVDEFVKHKKVVSVSVTVTEGPSDFLALIVYREKKNGYKNQRNLCMFDTGHKIYGGAEQRGRKENQSDYKNR